MTSVDRPNSNQLHSWPKAFIVTGYAVMAIYGGLLLSERFWLGLALVFFGVAAVFLGAGWPGAYAPLSRQGVFVYALCGIGMILAFGTLIALQAF